MRSNIEQVRIWDSKLVAARFGALSYTLTGDLVLTRNNPSVLALNANGVDRNVYLPVLGDERMYVFGNFGTLGNLVIRDNGGVLLLIIPPNFMYIFFSSVQQWIYMGSYVGGADPTGWSEQLRVVTAAGTVTISSTEAGVVLNKAVASVTPVNLPLASTRNGKPVRILDWAGTTDITNPIQVSPTGADKINNSAGPLEVIQTGVTLVPHVTLGGYLVNP